MQKTVLSKISNEWRGGSRRDFLKLAGSYCVTPFLLSANAEANPGFVIRKAPLVRLPGAKNPDPHKKEGVTDCNSPSHWVNNTLYVFGSLLQPWRTSGPDLFHLKPVSEVEELQFDNPELKRLSIWIESSHQDEDGRLYGWIHNELPNLCRKSGGVGPAGYPAVVRMGALRSDDNGLTWKDLGFIIEDPASSILCDTEDTWYAGGMGDFCVLPDRAREWFYFFFAHYGNKFEDQGLCLARMRYGDRDNPRTKVWMWTGVDWSEPGLGGRPKPFFPAAQDITHADGQIFWGPVVHWNTYLKKYVMFLNRIRNTKWETEGLYVSYSSDLGNPHAWSHPVKFMDREEIIHADPEHIHSGWYVEVMGTHPGETDKLAGRTVRLFVEGASIWEIEFQK